MSIERRKNEHIKLAFEEKIVENDFDKIKLSHIGLPKFELSDIDLSTTFLNKQIPYPIYINAMTGGSKNAYYINKKLALYAKHFNIPIILGSQSAALKNKELEYSYKVVREINPKGIVVANISPNYNYKDAENAINMIDADALSIHINLIQELVMQEGDRKFLHWRENIKEINKKINKPVLVKEVGFGMSEETINDLIQLGVKNIDVSGSGGTNFARIERKRKNSYDKTFEYLGISTPDSLLNAKNKDVNVYASGGIRNALDIFKALLLGAEAVGMSRYFLNLTTKKDAEAILEIEELINNLKKLFLIYGYKNISEMR